MVDSNGTKFIQSFMEIHQLAKMLLQSDGCVNMTELQVHPSLQTKKRRLKTGEFQICVCVCACMMYVN